MSEQMNGSEKTTNETFSEEIRKALAAPDSGKPSLEEFKVMVYKDRERRRRKRSAAVACAAVILIAGFFTFDYLVPEVGADKNPKEEIITEDGVIIEDGGYGSSVGEENVWVVTEWEDVDKIKSAYKDMLVLTYIPTGYEFNLLTVDKTETDALMFKYYFETNGQSLSIEIFQYEGGVDAQFVFKETRSLECEKGKIYCINKEKATIKLDDGVIVIYGALPDAEIIKLVESIC